jgi:hypothetical protein
MLPQRYRGGGYQLASSSPYVLSFVLRLGLLVKNSIQKDGLDSDGLLCELEKEFAAVRWIFVGRIGR